MGSLVSKIKEKYWFRMKLIRCSTIWNELEEIFLRKCLSIFKNKFWILSEVPIITPSPSLFLLCKRRIKQNSNFIKQWDYEMSHGNWAFLFLGRDELETTFNTASKKKSLWERQKKKIKKKKKMQIYYHFSGSWNKTPKWKESCSSPSMCSYCFA